MMPDAKPRGLRADFPRHYWRFFVYPLFIFPSRPVPFVWTCGDLLDGRVFTATQQQASPISYAQLTWTSGVLDTILHFFFFGLHYAFTCFEKKRE